MCIGMNADVLPPHERSASTSNRNLRAARAATAAAHLVSPVMAAPPPSLDTSSMSVSFDVEHVE